MFGSLLEAVRSEVDESRTRHRRPQRDRNYDSTKGPEMQTGSKARGRMMKPIGGAQGGGKLTYLGQGFSSKHGQNAADLRKSVKTGKARTSRRKMAMALRQATKTRETPTAKRRTTSGEAQRMAGSPRTNYR